MNVCYLRGNNSNREREEARARENNICVEESPPRCVGGGALPAQTPMKVKPGRNKEKKFKFIAAKPCFSFGLRGRKGFYASVETGIDSVFPKETERNTNFPSHCILTSDMNFLYAQHYSRPREK